MRQVLIRIFAMRKVDPKRYVNLKMIVEMMNAVRTHLNVKMDVHWDKSAEQMDANAFHVLDLNDAVTERRIPGRIKMTVAIRAVVEVIYCALQTNAKADPRALPLDHNAVSTVVLARNAKKNTNVQITSVFSPSLGRSAVTTVPHRIMGVDAAYDHPKARKNAILHHFVSLTENAANMKVK